MTRETLAGDLAFRLEAASKLQHALQRRVAVLRDAQRQLAIGRAPAVVIALVAEHEPALAKHHRQQRYRWHRHELL